MELPTIMLKKDLLSLNLSWVTSDNVALGSLNQSQQKDTKQTIILLQEVANEPTGYANSTFKRWHIEVEMQIFWALKPRVNIQEQEVSLMRSLLRLGWKVQPHNSNHTVDPDTKQTTKTIYLDKEI
ncbi:DUF806 family protein [Lactobacillus sp. ESL0677]|uniref:DUF806 family protein n=1 Tax=Lactobacillus sp. ESL0677 TaxID=2983208 RepID=UPI0023F82F60|nr:DUF806 family protein [Lactobacillus sp. ESL0677]WEV36216.1 DUF806 family protein [Lactobacillus sp. ESL0677]